MGRGRGIQEMGEKETGKEEEEGETEWGRWTHREVDMEEERRGTRQQKSRRKIEKDGGRESRIK